jgi:nucleoside phosphorylase
VGIAGGMAAGKINLGDILISDQIVDYESQKLTPEGAEVRWVVHQADPRMLIASNDFRDKNWIDLIKTERPDQEKPNRYTGSIASGDKVIAFGEILARYQHTWPKLIGVEMEAAGAATAAFQSVDKPGFFMVRSVSDLADEHKNTDGVQEWRSYACDAAATFTIEFLRSGPVPLQEGANHKTQQGQLMYRAGINGFTSSRQFFRKPVGIPDNMTGKSFLDEHYQEHLVNLRNRIIGNNCCAFIGAGLSIPAGYPSWSGLLDKLKAEAEYRFGREINDAHLDYYERAEEYRKILGVENYRNIIRREFDPENNKQPWLPVHSDIVGLPFVSYVTTNYDCIFENVYKTTGVTPVYYYYPILPITHLRDRSIFHIHGIIDHSKLVETQDSIILTKSDFVEAYTPDSNLLKLTNCLFTELTLFFIGFNVNDPFMMRILRSSLSELEKTRQIAYERGIGPLPEIKHYALLPYHKKISADDLYDRRTYHEENDIDATNFEDEELKLMGVRTIRYTSDMYNHTQLINIIHNYLYLPIRAKENPTSYDLTFRGE